MDKVTKQALCGNKNINFVNDYSFVVVKIKLIVSLIYLFICSELSRIFGLDDYKDNLKTGILVDLYYYTIQFCRDHKFSKEQTSAFFSIVKRTHEVCIGKFRRERSVLAIAI